MPIFFPRPARARLLGRALATLALPALIGLLLAGCGQVTSTTRVAYSFYKSFNQSGGFGLPAVLTRPAGLLVLGDGTLIREVWVMEDLTGRLSRYTFDGQFQRSAVGLGPEAGSPSMVQGPDSMIYVAENAPNEAPTISPMVAVFDTSATFRRYFQLDTTLIAPTGLSTTGGLLYVSETDRDQRTGQVEVFNTQGQRQRVWGRSGADTLVHPTGIAARDSSIWVCDRGRQKLMLFRPDGRMVFSFGTVGSGPGQWNAPGTVAITDDGNLLVSDTGNHRVQEYQQDGTFVGQFGASALGNPASFTPGAIAVYSPTSLGEYLYVADYQAGQVYILIRAKVVTESHGRLLQPRS